ncbi:acetylornithine deacetylase [Sphingopyxis panaciterrae]
MTGPGLRHDDNLAPALGAAAIDILARLIAFDTTSSASNLALIDYIETYLAGHGVASRRIANADGSKANLLATIGPADGRGIVLSGHTDVVPVAGQPWSQDPFTLTEANGRLYGRGTADMKSFIALALAAIPYLTPRSMTRPVHLAFSYDEEIGCLGAPDLIDALVAEGHRPAAAIIGEPTDMAIVNSHKGIHLYEVVVTGREAHSSLVHEGVSANMIAIDILTVLARIAESERADHRDPRFDPPWSTLTVGTIHGGTAPNILARECRFTFDLRTVPDRDVDAVLAPFWAAVEAARERLVAEGDETGVAVHSLAEVPPLRREEAGAAERLTAMLSEVDAPASAVSYGAEAGQFQNAGMSTVICGPGSILQAHRPDEYIEIAQIEAGARFMSRLIAITHAE